MAQTARFFMQKLKKIYKKNRANKLANKLIILCEKVTERLKK
jgi:hypothetical protein